MSPNILFITCHDLGRHLGTYGRGDAALSPAIDEIAQQGVTFDNSFCTAPQCSPSRAALHTGRHAHAVGVLGLSHPPFAWALAPEHGHAAGRLRQAGYETALIGMQHVAAYDRLEPLGYNQVSGVAPAPQIAAQTEAFLRNARQLDRPFYLEVGFFEPHRPYDWGGVAPAADQEIILPAYVPNTPAARQDFAALHGAIGALDRAMGRIFDALQKNGLAEETLLIFTTDHGLAMPRAKAALYDPGLETALIMHWPARGLHGGRRVSELISHVDILPTMLAAIGLPPGETLHGRSFWPLLQNQTYRPNEYIFAEKSYHSAYEPMRAVRTGRYKLIVNFEVGPLFDVPGDVRQSPIYPHFLDQIETPRPYVELYDLEQDAQETVNLAGRPEMAEVERDLRHRLRAWMAETGDPLLQGPIASSFYETALKRLQHD